VWKSWPPAGKRRGEWWQKTWPIIGPEAGFVWIPRCRRSALVLLLATLPLHGCVWRGGATEHYLGPVLFRYTPSQEDKPAINQVVALGVLGEGGRQWGLSLGVVERTTVSPQFIGGTEPGATPDSPRWSTPLNPLRSPAAGRWHLSPFYLRVDGVQPPGLLARRLYGLQLLAGPEARAASFGMMSLMRIEVPDDAIALVRFDPNAPLTARFSVWRSRPDHELPLTDILEEMSP
jgi:hypothetical protein